MRLAHHHCTTKPGCKDVSGGDNNTIPPPHHPDACVCSIQISFPLSSDTAVMKFNSPAPTTTIFWTVSACRVPRCSTQQLSLVRNATAFMNNPISLPTTGVVCHTHCTVSFCRYNKPINHVIHPRNLVERTLN